MSIVNRYPYMIPVREARLVNKPLDSEHQQPRFTNSQVTTFSSKPSTMETPFNLVTYSFLSPVAPPLYEYRVCERGGMSYDLIVGSNKTVDLPSREVLPNRRKRGGQVFSECKSWLRHVQGTMGGLLWKIAGMAVNYLRCMF
jgi:hypothetical protein